VTQLAASSKKVIVQSWNAEMLQPTTTAKFNPNMIQI